MLGRTFLTHENLLQCYSTLIVDKSKGNQGCTRCVLFYIHIAKKTEKSVSLSKHNSGISDKCPHPHCKSINWRAQQIWRVEARWWALADMVHTGKRSMTPPTKMKVPDLLEAEVPTMPLNMSAIGHHFGGSTKWTHIQNSSNFTPKKKTTGAARFKYRTITCYFGPMVQLLCERSHTSDVNI